MSVTGTLPPAVRKRLQLDAPQVGDTLRERDSAVEAVVISRERDERGAIWIGYRCTVSPGAFCAVGHIWERFQWDHAPGRDDNYNLVSRSWYVVKRAEWKPCLPP